MAFQDAAPFDPARVGQNQIELRVLELLAARLCHELSGPVAAISNGLELFAEEGSEFIGNAAALVGESARKAGSRLQFYRFAYGYSDGSSNTGPPPHELAASFFADSRIAVNYPVSVRTLPLEWQKLACNLLAAAAEALPRGGRLALTVRPVAVEAVGEPVLLSPDIRAALSLTMPPMELTARTVQHYFSGLLAQALDCQLIATAAPGRVRLAAIMAEA